MKKFAICLAALLLVGIFVMYNEIFPKAQKIEYPDYSQIESITVSENGEFLDLSQEELRVLYSAITKARPTRKMSVNDAPDAKHYYTVNIKTDKLSVSYGYIYEEYGKTYFEIPYMGIYVLN